jgi:acetylornithine deacetylase/succinyl-diaminopimelate desuccinylase-like protein
MDRRDFLYTAAATSAIYSLSPDALAAQAQADAELEPLRRIIEQQHDQNLKRLQDWIKLPSIAAENRNMHEGAQLMIDMLKDAGFDTAVKVPSDGHPGVFATLDAGAKNTLGLYFMYDVKQGDGEWSVPPFEGRLVDKAGFGKVVMARGAVNQKGPENSFLGALQALKAAGRKSPVNIVFVAEGEEEIGSPHFAQIVRRPEISAALQKTKGVFMPGAGQGADGNVILTLGAKGVVELELTSSGERWGRGPAKDVHSSNKARLDSPVWHLVHALATLTTKDGNEIAIPGYAAKARPVSAAEKKMIADAAKRLDENVAKKGMGVSKWMNDATFEQSLTDLVSRPTINIEGIIGGYTGPGGKTVLPTKASVKLDLRLVPDMKAEEAVQAVKNQLAKNGYGDIEVKFTGGYDPNSTALESPLIQTSLAAYRKFGVEPILLPRNAGSWPGYVFTGDPLRLPAGHFGMGHGSGAHAPDEYYVIESSNPKVKGLDGAVESYVTFLYALAGMK